MTAHDEALQDPRFTGALDLLRRTGAKAVQIRWSDDEAPTVWFVVVEWRVDPARGIPVPEDEAGHEQGFEVDAAFHPRTALFRLCERILNQSSWCVHCRRPAGFDAEQRPRSTDPREEAAEARCFYRWDPERETFRRSCEGVVTAPGRNEPCICGSGRKFKKCCGA